MNVTVIFKLEIYWKVDKHLGKMYLYIKIKVLTMKAASFCIQRLLSAFGPYFAE